MRDSSLPRGTPAPQDLFKADTQMTHLNFLTDAEKPGVQGMTTAASHADPADLEIVRTIATAFARNHAVGTFTSEDVIAGLTDAQRDRLSAFPNAMGGVFFQLARQGVIIAQGYVSATKPEARGRAIRLWRGRTVSDA